jgi:hypothetical protein
LCSIYRISLIVKKDCTYKKRMARIDKKFVLSTSQLNSHKFRCLTEGAQLDDFKANPVMYWLHQTPAGKGKDEPMPIGFWEDIKVEGDEITAYPNINDNDPFALSIGKMVEHGTIRAASIEADPIELDTNKANWLPGQKLPTLKRFNICEASIVDRGSNKGAIVKLKHNGQSINLSDQVSTDAFFNHLQEPEEDSMKIKLNAKAAKALKLSADSEQDAMDVVDKLVGVIEANQTRITELDGELVTLKVSECEGRITLMLDKAEADGKILAGAKPKLKKMALRGAEAEADVKDYLDGLKGSTSVESQLGKAAEGNDAELAKLMKLSFDELFEGEGLTKLKAVYPESYKLKYKEKFNTEPV